MVRAAGYFSSKSATTAMPQMINTAATKASGQLVGGDMLDSLPLVAGLSLSFIIVAFILWKIHRKELQAPMAGTLGLLALLAPICLGAIGASHSVAQLPGGAKVESW